MKSAREVEDVAELMQHIQSRLPVEEAARTSVLSKSWLHAWSTIPTLILPVSKHIIGKSMKFVDADHTLTRYLRDNTPIERFEFLIDIDNQDSASHAEKWIGPVVTKPCLKELFLTFLLYSAPFTLPDEILSSENLTKIRVYSPIRTHSVWMTTPVINCVSLRELHLEGVRISEDALHDILSSCKLLEKIYLIDSCKGFKTIKVKNLPCLYELIIYSQDGDDDDDDDDEDGSTSTALEISHVPNLGVFICNLPFPFNSHSISLGSKVTQLRLGGDGMVTDTACLDMIASGFPFLESLTLDDMTSWMSESFHFTSASIKRLSLRSCMHMLTDIQIHAPKLLFFWFDGDALPDTLLFPVSTLKQIIVQLKLDHPVDANFFLKMREALTLSRRCDIRISAAYDSLGMIDMDDLRTRLLLPPAMNVQQLSFETVSDECLWERSPFFDAFFEICHPKRVYAKPDTRFKHNNHFCRLMLKEVLEKTETTGVTMYWPQYLQHVQIRETRHKKWETLTNSHTSFLDGSTPGVSTWTSI